MKIWFVRHGNPNYAKDCLTEIGQKQAEATAVRMQDIHLDAIYSSGCGRAYETALPTAQQRGMTVTRLPFLNEIAWGPKEKPYSYGHLWHTADALARAGADLLTYDYASHPELGAHTCLWDHVARVTGGFDAFMETLGYVREGKGYRCVRKNDDTLAIFSHKGASTCVFAHLAGVPVPYFAYFCSIYYASLTLVEFDAEVGGLLVPRFRVINDYDHVKSIHPDLGEW